MSRTRFCAPNPNASPPIPTAVSSGVTSTPSSCMIIMAAAPKTMTRTAFVARPPIVCSRLTNSERSLAGTRDATTCSRWPIPSEAIRTVKYASAPISATRSPSSNSQVVARSSGIPYSISTPMTSSVGRVAIPSMAKNTRPRTIRIGRRLIGSRKLTSLSSRLTIIKIERSTRDASCATTSAITTVRLSPTARSCQLTASSMTVMLR